jgi:hypothetical protein
MNPKIESEQLASTDGAGQQAGKIYTPHGYKAERPPQEIYVYNPVTPGNVAPGIPVHTPLSVWANV